VDRPERSSCHLVASCSLCWLAFLYTYQYISMWPQHQAYLPSRTMELQRQEYPSMLVRDICAGSVYALVNANTFRPASSLLKRSKSSMIEWNIRKSLTRTLRTGSRCTIRCRVAPVGCLPRIQERRRVEEQYSAALKKLAARQLSDEATDLGYVAILPICRMETWQTTASSQRHGRKLSVPSKPSPNRITPWLSTSKSTSNDLSETLQQRIGR